MRDTFRILDLDTALRTILVRRPFEEMEIPAAMRAGIERVFGEALDPAEAVDRILRDVRERGDEALRDYNRRIEGAETPDLEVPAAELEEAWAVMADEVRDALMLSAERIRVFHERQYRQSWLDWEADGGALGQMIRPLDRVGIYAPGGRAPYPSSLLMSAIPARVAGVEHVVISSPPGRDGRVAPVLLAAARVAGVDSVYRVGGAQAVAALAYGTQTVPAVAKILGPGNLFVMLAKRRVFGVVGIDGLPGPTETVVIADEAADPSLVAADLLAQAEHDVLATPICLTPSAALSHAVVGELERQVARLPRRDVIAQAFGGRGGIVLTRDVAEAVEVASVYAPEHLCLLVRDPWSWVGRVRNAGGIFVGETASEALGDYVVGPSHIMPTGGTARWGSPCNVWDFLKITSVYAPSPRTSASLSPAAARLARAEGLEGHAAALERRMMPATPAADPIQAQADRRSR
jgi:histidinol dehydrogenase